MRHALAALAAAVVPLLPALAGEPPSSRPASDCTIKAGPNDRVAQGEDLIIPSGAVVNDAVAIRGNVVIKRGARVRKALAGGGSVTVEAGAVVTTQVVAIGGDVVVEAAARVGGEAVSLGGQVRLAPGGSIEGSIVGLALQFGGTSLARTFLDGLHAEGPCRVVRE